MKRFFLILALLLTGCTPAEILFIGGHGGMSSVDKAGTGTNVTQRIESPKMKATK